jgi:hypothetical protein
VNIIFHDNIEIGMVASGKESQDGTFPAICPVAPLCDNASICFSGNASICLSGNASICFNGNAIIGNKLLFFSFPAVQENYQ